MLLVVETSSRTGSVALVDADGVHSLQLLGEVRDHAKTLAATVERLVDDWERIDGFAVSIGPGSFTGLRIGVAFLKGLAMVHPRPAVAVSSLEGLAQGIVTECSNPAGPVLTMLDARQGHVFAAMYGPDMTPDETVPEGLHSALGLAKQIPAIDAAWRVGGDGVDVFRNVTSSKAMTVVPVAPRADYVAVRAWRHWQDGRTLDTLELSPKYHQLSAAEVNLSARVKAKGT